MMLTHPQALQALWTSPAGELVRHTLADHPSPGALIERLTLRDEDASRGPDDTIRSTRGSPWALARAGRSLWLSTQTRALERWDWDDPEQPRRVERLTLGGPLATWTHLVGARDAATLAGLDQDATLHVIDLDARCVARQPLGGRPAALALSDSGRWLAAAITQPRGGFIRLWRVLGEGKLALHMSALDRRAIHGPTRALERGHVRLDISPDEQTLFVYESAQPRTSAWDGWRAQLIAVELERARRLWSAPLDHELTGDARPLDQLRPEDPDGSPGALLCERSAAQPPLLWCGTSAGALIALDARDGALRATWSLGTHAALLDLARDARGALWARSELGRLLRVPSER